MLHVIVKLLDHWKLTKTFEAYLPPPRPRNLNYKHIFKKKKLKLCMENALCYWNMPMSAVDDMLAGDADANVFFDNAV